MSLITSTTQERAYTPSNRIQSPAFQTMCEVAAGLENKPLKAFRENGGKVIGFLCSMAPDELFMAAGALGFRVRGTGSTNTDLADNYFTNLNCTFPRHALNMGMEGEYDFLDGIVYLNSCDHIRRMYDNWKREVPTGFIEFLTLPKQTGEDQIKWFTEEFQILREKMEKHWGIEITDEKLREAIRLGNKTRQLQRRLYELRKQDDPPITGAEVLTVMVAGTAMPKEEYSKLLEELLQELEGKQGTGKKYRARLMVTGGILDDPKWIHAVEEVGGLVVVDGLCFGGRIMWEDIDESIEDPVKAMAQYYLADRPSCPRMFDKQKARVEFTANAARDYKVDGVIGAKMIFCDQWNVENYLLKNDLYEEEIPFMSVEREYITTGTGQLKTRIQAFIESLGK